MLDGSDLWSLAAVIVAVLAVASYAWYRIRMRRSMPEGKPLEELEGQKRELEDLLATAKGKYHRREIDDETFREITVDYQKKLVVLETKIKALETSKKNV